jgi:group I intron endonuclease
MYGKKHSIFALSKISKPGHLNPMFNKTHSLDTRKKISIRLSKNPVGLYTVDKTLIKMFLNQVELAAYLGIHKSTIGRYLRTGKLLSTRNGDKYYIFSLGKGL